MGIPVAQAANMTDRFRCNAGLRFSPYPTSNFPITSAKTALNRHFYALLDRR